MHRLFVALRPTSTQRRALDPLMTGIDGARWQNDEQLHVTLRFIGTVDRHQAEDIAAACGTVCAPPVMIGLVGTGAFDRRGRVHSLWAGVATDPGLTHLHRKIAQALARVGVTGDGRAFLPHVTVARLSASRAAVAPWLNRTAGLTVPAERIAAFMLFESRLGSEGASYEAIARYPLTG